MNARHGLLRSLLSENPFQPATSWWRAIELAVVLQHGLPRGTGLDLGCGDGKRVGRFTADALLVAALVALLAAMALASLVDYAVAWPLAARIALAAAVLVPFGVILGIGLPGGMRLLDRARPEVVAWGWGMNGAFSVIGATAAIFIAMNWGYSVTLSAGAAAYLLAAVLLTAARRPRRSY